MNVEGGEVGVQLQLDGYDVFETLDQSARAVLIRARRRSDGVSVIIKLLAGEHPTPEDVDRLRHEHDIACDLDLPGVVRPLGVERFGHRVGLVLEDFGGQPLATVIGPAGLEVEPFLCTALSLADVLGQVHAAEVIHKDVKPTNVLVEPDSGAVKLADFGLATRISDQDPKPSSFQGTLAYLSPEQTGRTEQAPDHRSDLYSLGVTFYEMLTGRVPFPTEDPLEVIHCHLAVRPVPPAELNPKIPPVVSDIVDKLLAKQPEARYQSAYGLHRDLEACLASWRDRRAIEPFPLGGHDRAGRFLLPDRLYGREEETRILLGAFQRVTLGGAALALISGASGVGKSALVHDVHPAITARGGWLVEGKFDQYSQGGPYASLIAAVRQLIRLVLGEPADQLSAWKRRILDTLGANTGLVIEVVPEVALVTGEVPPPTEVGPTEAQNRFRIVFSQFLGLFARPEQPLVIFFDDLHWADVDSLRLVRDLVVDPDAAHLLVIGAYRPETVSGSHPLALTLIEPGSVPVEHLELLPLPSATANEFVADALATPVEEAAPLAALLHARTGGNPFFLGELLRSLARDGLLSFSASDGRWTWDPDEIRRRGTTDDVIELMAAKLAQLAPETQEALRTAAVVGNRFDLPTLALVLGRTEDDTASALGEALDHDVVLRSDGGFRFLHDRVQQACHSMIPADEEATLHLKVGRLLLERLRQRDIDDDLFTVTAHLNAAAGLLTDPAARLEVAELNLAAARKARASSAYQAAAAHVSSGLGLLPEDAWATAYGVTFELSLFRAQVLAVLGEVEQGEEIFEMVLQRARSDTDKAVCCDARSEVLHSAGRPADAYAVARSGLRMLGVALPEDADEAAQEAAVLLEQLLDPSVVTRLQSLQPGDERALLVGRLFWRATIGAYYSQPADLPLVVCRYLDHLLRTGMTPEASLALALLGFIAVLQGQLEPGTAYAEAAIDLAQRFADTFVRGRTECVAWVLCLCWKHPFEASERALHDAFLTCHSVGDLEFGNHTMIGTYVSALMPGRDWHAILERSQRWLDYCERFVPLEAGQARIRLDGARRIMALEREPLDAEGIISRYAEDGDATDVCESLNELACTETLFGEYQAAYDHAVRAEPDIVAGAAGTLLFNLAFFVHYGVAGARLGHLDKVDAILERLHPLAEFNPDSFASYLSLLEAERARAKGDTDAAVLAYLRTIGHAGAHRYLTLEAFAHELLGRLLAESGHRSAVAHLREAHGVYLEGGARGKALQLEAEVPALVAPGRRGVLRSGSVSTDPGLDRGAALDLESVLKASQAIARELTPERVVARLIAISIENAGAERAVFVSVDGDDIRVEAEGRAGTDAIVEHGSTALDATVDVVLPRTVRYVARTGEPLVIGDPAHVPKSLLVLPIARQQRITGILYLENDLVAGAFTPARLESLRVLSAQMSISLENSRLYAQLEEKVRHRTAELSETLDNLRAAQRQIVESEKLAALGGLVAGVAHEINTPVGIAVTAASHLTERTWELREAVESGALKRSALESFLDTVEEAGGLVVSNLGRAAELVRSFKQVAVDQSSEARRTFEFRRYLEDILQSLRPKLKRAPHRIEIDCDEELTVTSYPGAVAQVVTNLVMNSLVHGYDHGQEGTIRFVVSAHAGGVRLVYSDDGRGVAPDVLERMFDPFFTTRRGTGGSGLGLHIVHNLVTQRLAGAVSAHSTPGQGTAFTIDIPSHD